MTTKKLDPFSETLAPDPYEGFATDAEAAQDLKAEFTVEQSNDLALMVAVLAGDTDGTVFNETLKGLQEQGASEHLSDVRQQAVIENDEAARQGTIDAIVAADSPEAASEALQEAQMERGNPDIAVEFAYTTAQIPASTPKGDEFRDGTYNATIEGIQARRDIDNLLQERAATYDASTVNALRDLSVLAVTPLLEGDTTARLAELYLEDDRNLFGKIWDRVLPGERLKQVRNTLAGMRPEEKAAEVRKLIAAVDQSQLVGTNEMLELQLLITAINDPPEGFDWDRAIANVVGVFDAVYLGRIASLGVRGVKMIGAGRRAREAARSSAAAARILAETSPDKFRQLLNDAKVDATDATLRSMGMTGEQLVEETLPVHSTSRLRAGPDSLRDRQIGEEARAMEVVSRPRLGVLLDDTEKNSAILRQQRVLEESHGGVLHINKTVISDYDELGIGGVAMYGEDASRGFSRVNTALERVDDLAVGTNTDPELVRIFQRDFKTGRLKVVSKNKVDDLVAKEDVFGDKAPVTGEYFVAVPFKREFSEVDAMWTGNKNTTLKLFNQWFGRWSGDASQLFSPDWVRRVYRVADVATGIRADLNKMLNDGWRPIARSRKAQARVMAAIDQGSRDGNVYTARELSEFFGIKTNREINAYRTMRNVNDALYSMTNRRMYRDMVNKGLREVHVGDDVFAAKILDELEIDGEFWAWDPVTKNIRKFTHEQATRYVNDGNFFGKMEDVQFGGDGTGTRFIAIPGDAGTVRALRPNVLKYRPGYFPRMYKESYFIDKIGERVIDGVREPYVRTIGAVPTRKEAVRKARALQEDARLRGEKWTYNPRPDRSLTTGEQQFQDARTTLENQGRLFYSPRGERLMSDGVDPARIEDPITATQNAIESISRGSMLDDFIRAEVRRFKGQYGELLGRIDPRNGPELDQIWKQVRDLRSTKIPKGVRAEMNAKIEYLAFLNGSVANADMGAAWRIRMLAVAEWLEGVPLVGRLVSDSAKSRIVMDPGRAAKSVPFSMFLVGNPTRQFFLQAQQQLFLAGVEPAFVLSGNAARRGILLNVGLAARDKPEMWKVVREFGAKHLKMSEDEFTTLIGEYRTSGMVAGIDSHQFTAAHLWESGLAPASGKIDHFGRQLAKVYKAPLRFMKKVGFEWGEAINLGASFNVAIRRFERFNKRKPVSRADWDWIGGHTRELALSMNKEGTFKWQRGFFSLMTQFLSIQVKALNAMIPEFAGGAKTFTGREKAKIAAGQLALFGIGGSALGGMYDEFKEFFFGDEPLPDEVDQALRGGMVDIMFNAAVTAISGEESDISIASDWSASAGPLTSIADLLESLAEMDGEVLLGATGSAGSRVGEIIQYMKDIRRRPDLSTEQKMIEHLKAPAELFSGYSNYIKMKHAIRTGYMVDNMGRENVQVTFAEARIRGWMGLGTVAEDDYYAVLKDKRKWQEAVEGDAKQFAKSFIRWMRRTDQDSSTDSYLRMVEFITKAGLDELRMLGAQDDEERVMFWNAWARELSHVPKPGQQSAFEDLGRLLMRGQIGPYDRIEAAIASHSHAFTPEQMKRLREAIDAMQENYTFKPEEEDDGGL